MNELIKQLAAQAGAITSLSYEHDGLLILSGQDRIAKFAELVIQEHINLLQQEWYRLKNLPNVVGETPRDIGRRSGKKSEIVALQYMIKKHFGVKQ